MSLRNEREFENTQAKLARLEARCKTLCTQKDGDAELREMTIESLKRTTNQFKKEIARFRARQLAGRV